jgi:hypothetical protein
MAKSKDAKPDDLITATEGRGILRCGPHKFKELMDKGTLATFADPIDRRVRLVSRAEVERLKASSVRAAA